MDNMSEIDHSIMRMYIAVLSDVPDHMVPTLVAHTMLWASDELAQDPSYQAWKQHSFRKCVVRLSQREWSKLLMRLQEANTPHTLGHENKTLNGAKSCCIPAPFAPSDVPNVLKSAKLWTPTNYED